MKKQLLLLSVVLLPSLLFSQGIMISPNPGSPPNSSAILELSDSTRGFLLSRLTTTQRNAMVAPAVGLQIYNLSTNCINVYFPSGWKQTECECTVAPLQPGNITGPAQFCLNQLGIQYSIAPVANATSYTWTVPSGATIVTGQGTTTITVNFGVTGGNITVTANNSCGISPVRQTAVATSVPSAIFTPTQVAVNTPATFIPQAGYSSYSWTFQGGSPVSSFLQNPQVTWTNQGTYSVTLTVMNSFGCTATLTQQVTANTCLGSANFTFTNCNVTGRLGPTQQDCDNTYGPAVVTVVNGMQEWTVPNNVCPGTAANFEAWGAQGGGSQGGLGAYIKGTFTINPGDIFRIVVGQRGADGSCGDAGGGAGASYIVKRVSTVFTPMIVAAGGGGGNSAHIGGAGSGSLSANPVGGVGSACGNGSGGGGYQGDGTGGCGGLSFINGSTGGTGSSNGGDGGFGGGGGSSGDTSCGTSADLSGGGGYEGGTGAGSNGPGGGGLSYNSGSNQTNQGGVRTGHGQVIISW